MAVCVCVCPSVCVSRESLLDMQALQPLSFHSHTQPSIPHHLHLLEKVCKRDIVYSFIRAFIVFDRSYLGKVRHGIWLMFILIELLAISENNVVSIVGVVMQCRCICRCLFTYHMYGLVRCILVTFPVTHQTP